MFTPFERTGPELTPYWPMGLLCIVAAPSALTNLALTKGAGILFPGSRPTRNYHYAARRSCSMPSLSLAAVVFSL